MGAAELTRPLPAAPGLAQAAPRIVLRYSSGSVDALGTRGQAQPTGLGWTLDVGGVIARDTKGTATTTDDTFEILMDGVRYPLVQTDGVNRIWHTKDEQFWRIQYAPSGSGDDWTLTTKEGTRYRFGSTPDSRWRAINPSRTGAWTHRWLLSELVTPNNVAVQYEYEKQVATYSQWTYDQAVYPLRIHYSYHNGALVGPLREVVFTLEARQDYANAGSLPAYYARKRISGLDVLVGGALVRRYVFSQGYSVDRDPGYTWDGGATGDLTLTAVTEVAPTGASLPPAEFTYHADGVLRAATSSIGGTTTFAAYDRIRTLPLGNYAQYSTPATVAHIAKEANLGNRTLYEICTIYYNLGHEQSCGDWGVSTSNGPMSRVLGYLFAEPREGSRMVYSACLTYYPPADAGDSGSCGDWGVTSSPNAQWARPLGYAYVGPLDRRRVAQREADDGRQASPSIIRFTYGVPGLSADGRTFRGHSWVKVVDPANHYTVVSFHQDEARKGRPSGIKWHEAAPTSGGDGRVFRQVDLTWQGLSNPAFPGTTFAALTQRTVRTFDGDAAFKETRETYAYDGLGNLTTSEHHGDTSISGDERTETFEYAPNTGAEWIVGLPSQQAIKSGLGSGAVLLATRWLRYDGVASDGTPPVMGNLTQQIDWWDGGADPSVSWTYDAYGNIRTRTDARGFTTEITYDATQTFPSTISSPPTIGAGGPLVTTYTYDPAHGVLRTVRDPNGRSTEYQYDGFGRLERIVDALSQETRIAYEDWGIVGSQRTTVRRPDETGSADGIWRSSYFDGLGRTFETQWESATPGVPIVQSVEYDARGLVARTSLPRFAGSTPQWTTYAYDAVGRLRRRDLPDLNFEEWTYNDWTIAARDLRGFTSTYVSDAYGRVERVIEPGSPAPETTYTYDALDRLVTVRDALLKTTSIQYDTLSRRRALDDPTLGPRMYTYDENGNLIEQRDAKNQLISFEYDALDRLVRKVYPDGRRMVFTYDSGVDALGRLTRAAELDSLSALTVANEYEYDPLGRVKTLIRTVDTTSYATRFEYTPFDALKYLTYPDGERLTYGYDTAGRVSSVVGVQDSVSTTYLESATYNATGQPTRMRRHGNVLTDGTFSATRLWLDAVRSAASTTTLQDLVLGRDPAGNILSVQNNVNRAFDQTFQYDALDRLTQAVGPYGARGYAYDAVGNLLSKAGVTYAYGVTAQACGRPIPHAVASTSSGFSGTYDCNGNLLGDGDRTFVWDQDDRPTAITHGAFGTTTFTYGPDGERLRKATASKTTRYAGWFEDRVEDNILIKHVFAGGRRIATRVSGGPADGVYVPLDDHLGSLHALVRGDAVTLRQGYLPFGETDPAQTSGSADWYQHRFTDQEQDPETELYYYGARYYNPKLGRFISPDPIVPSAFNPQSLNRYTYVLNNPVRYTDPTGRECCASDDEGARNEEGAYGESHGSFDVGSADGGPIGMPPMPVYMPELEPIWGAASQTPQHVMLAASSLDLRLEHRERGWSISFGHRPVREQGVATVPGDASGASAGPAAETVAFDHPSVAVQWGVAGTIPLHISLVGPFVSGSVVVGANTKGQIVGTAQVNLYLGLGWFAGWGFQTPVSVSPSALPGTSTDFGFYGEANAGFGPGALGVSGQASATSAGNSMTAPNRLGGRKGVGYGLNAGVGVFGSFTVASPPLW